MGTSSLDQLGQLELRNPIAAAAVEAIAYADVFDWPLAAEEIHRYLPVEARLEDVKAVLAEPELARWISPADELFVLRGREHLVDDRRRKAALSAALWPHAIRYGRILSCLPWVRLVAVTGSLAVSAATDDADIDLFIVTDDGRLWLARALTIAVVKVAARTPSSRGLRLCPNYFVAMSALDLPERDIYTARELAQLVPLFGPDTYLALVERNRWFRRFLPNHRGPIDPIGALGARHLRRLLEPLLRNGVVGRVERWEMERKIAKLSVASTDGEVRFDQSTCKGHFEGYRRHALDQFAQRLTRLRAADG